MLLLEQIETEDVVSRRENEKRDKEDETDDRGCFAGAKRDRLSLHGLHGTNQQVATVEDRNREQIDQAEVHGDDGEQMQIRKHAELGGLRRDLEQHDRTTDRVRR